MRFAQIFKQIGDICVSAYICMNESGRSATPANFFSHLCSLLWQYISNNHLRPLPSKALGCLFAYTFGSACYNSDFSG